MPRYLDPRLRDAPAASSSRIFLLALAAGVIVDGRAEACVDVSRGGWLRDHHGANWTSRTLTLHLLDIFSWLRNFDDHLLSLGLMIIPALNSLPAELARATAHHGVLTHRDPSAGLCRAGLSYRGRATGRR